MQISQKMMSQQMRSKTQLAISPDKQISSSTFQLPQHIQDHLKQKQQVFNTRQSLLLFTCKQDEQLTWKIQKKLKKERKYRQKNEKKEVARHVKSKLSAMFQQLPMMSRGSSGSFTQIKKRDSSLQLIMKHQNCQFQQLPLDQKKRQDKLDLDIVSKMQQNKHQIGLKKIEQKSSRRQSSEINVNMDRVRALEPIEVIPSIKGLNRKMSQSSLIDSSKKLSEQSQIQKMSYKYTSMKFCKKDRRDSSSKHLVAPEEMAINNNCSLLKKQSTGRYEQSKFIDFFEDDKIGNVKISTNEKMRLVKRREIVKSMKFIRNLGRELRQQKEQINKIIRSQTLKKKQLQDHISKLQAVESLGNAKRNKMALQQKNRSITFKQSKIRSSDNCVPQKKLTNNYGSPHFNITQYENQSPNQASLLKNNSKFRTNIQGKDQLKIENKMSRKNIENKVKQVEETKKNAPEPKKMIDILDQLPMSQSSMSSSGGNDSLSQISMPSKESNLRNIQLSKEMSKQVLTTDSHQPTLIDEESPPGQLIIVADGFQSKKALQQVSKKIDILNQSSQIPPCPLNSRQDSKKQVFNIQDTDQKAQSLDKERNPKNHFQPDFQQKENQSDRQVARQTKITNEIQRNQENSSVNSSENQHQSMNRIDLNFDQTASQNQKPITKHTSESNNSQRVSRDSVKKNYRSSNAQENDPKQQNLGLQTQDSNQDYQNEANLPFKIHQNDAVTNNYLDAQQNNNNQIDDEKLDTEEYYIEDTSSNEQQKSSERNDEDKKENEKQENKMLYGQNDRAQQKQYNSFQDARARHHTTLFQDNQSLKALQNKIEDMQNQDKQNYQVNQDRIDPAPEFEKKESTGLKMSKFSKLRQSESLTNQQSKKSSSNSQQVPEDSYGIESQGQNEVSSEYQQDSRMLLKLIQQSYQNNYLDRILEEDLSHISEEVESRFDETSGNQTIKSRFQNKLVGNFTHLSIKASEIDASNVQSSLTPVRNNNNNYDQMFLDQSINEDKQGSTNSNGVKNQKQQPMKSLTMAVRDFKSHKKLDSNTTSSNLHISTNSKRDTQTIANNNPLQYTPNEILEQSSQGSKDAEKQANAVIPSPKNYGNNMEANGQQSIKSPVQLHSDFQIEKSDTKDKDDQMHKIVFCNLNENSYNSRSQYSANYHQLAFENADFQAAKIRMNIYQSPVNRDNKPAFFSNHSSSDSSELEDSYDSEVAKQHQQQQDKDKREENHQTSNKLHEKLAFQKTQDLKNYESPSESLISDSSESAYQNKIDKNQVPANANCTNFKNQFNVKKDKMPEDKMDDTYNQKQQHLQFGNNQKQPQSNEPKQIKKEQFAKDIQNQIQESSLESNQIQEFDSCEENEAYIDIKSNLDMLEQFDQKHKKKEQSSGDEEIQQESSSPSEDLNESGQLLNPNLLRRDNFDNMKLSDMEEYYLTEIEQQQQADFMQKIMIDQKELENQINFRKLKREQSKVNRRQFLKGRQDHKTNSNVNLPTKSQIDKLSQFSQISYDNKVRYLQMQKLKMVEMRKNIFVFNVNKDDVKNLSEIDLNNLFAQQQANEDGQINSKNFHKHIDPQLNNAESQESSTQSKLLRYQFSGEPSPRRAQHAITSREEYMSSEESRDIKNEHKKDQSDQQPVNDSHILSNLAKEIRQLKERRTTNTIYSKKKQANDLISDKKESESSEQSHSLDSHQSIQEDTSSSAIQQIQKKSSSNSNQKLNKYKPNSYNYKIDSRQNIIHPQPSSDSQYNNIKQPNINLKNRENRVSSNMNEDEAKHGSFATDEMNNGGEEQMVQKREYSVGGADHSEVINIMANNASIVDLQASVQGANLLGQPEISEQSIDQLARPSMQLIRLSQRNAAPEKNGNREENNRSVHEQILRASNEQIHKAANEQQTQETVPNLNHNQDSNYSPNDSSPDFTQYNQNQQSSFDHQVYPSYTFTHQSVMNQQQNQSQNQIMPRDVNQSENSSSLMQISRMDNNINSQNIQTIAQSSLQILDQSKAKNDSVNVYDGRMNNRMVASQNTMGQMGLQLQLNQESSAQMNQKILGANVTPSMQFGNSQILGRNPVQNHYYSSYQTSLSKLSQQNIPQANYFNNTQKPVTQYNNLMQNQGNQGWGSISNYYSQKNDRNKQQLIGHTANNNYLQSFNNQSYLQNLQKPDMQSQKFMGSQSFNRTSPAARYDNLRSESINYNQSSVQSPKAGGHRRIKSNIMKNIKNNLKNLFDDLQTGFPASRSNISQEKNRQHSKDEGFDLSVKASRNYKKAQIQTVTSVKHSVKPNQFFFSPKNQSVKDQRGRHGYIQSFNNTEKNLEGISHGRVLSHETVIKEGHHARSKSKNEANRLIEQMSNKMSKGLNMNQSIDFYNHSLNHSITQSPQSQAQVNFQQNYDRQLNYEMQRSPAHQKQTLQVPQQAPQQHHAQRITFGNQISGTFNNEQYKETNPVQLNTFQSLQNALKSNQQTSSAYQDSLLRQQATPFFSAKQKNEEQMTFLQQNLMIKKKSRQPFGLSRLDDSLLKLTDQAKTDEQRSQQQYELASRHKMASSTYSNHLFNMQSSNTRTSQVGYHSTYQIGNQPHLPVGIHGSHIQNYQAKRNTQGSYTNQY